MSDPNPYIDAVEAARRFDAERAPFYATVDSVASPLVSVTPIGRAQSLGGCPASTAVVAAAAPGDVVVCIPVGGSVFVLAIKQA